MSTADELFELSSKLEDAAESETFKAYQTQLEAIEREADILDRSFSGSWLGYHSRVYYQGLAPAPAGANFSQEWGLMERYGSMGSKGDWQQFDPEQIKTTINERAGNPDLSEIRDASAACTVVFERCKLTALSILESENPADSDRFLSKLKDALEEIVPLTPTQVLQHMQPQGQIMSRDMTAIGQGTQAPAHLEVKSDIISLRRSFKICQKAADLCRQAASHIERKGKRVKAESRVGTNVFIGHGRSLLWRELKDFVNGRLGLPYDEFNRVPVAGITNIARLLEMLDAAAIAFIVLTAEDEMADGKLQARMNVIHEVGLFQGRLGFTKAIVVLEEGCEQFSNIEGLGQIRFPKGKMSAAFEDIRLVLEREKIIEA